MSDKVDVPKSKTLGGSNLPTRHYVMLETIPGWKFPAKGMPMTAWPWGETIHRIDETGHCITLGQLDELVKIGKIKGAERPKKVISKSVAVAD